MNVLFVYANVSIDPNHQKGYDYLGIAYLSAVLKKNNINTELFQVRKPISESEFVEGIKNYKTPDLIAFTSTTNQVYFVKKWADALRKSKNILTILGGVHATLRPEESLGLNGIDMICVGEGEDALLDVCKKIMNRDTDFSQIPNIWWKNGDKIYKNKPRPLIENLDVLPFPDKDIYDFIPPERYQLFASRGCPYVCSYCFNHSYTKETYGSAKNFLRFRTPENIIEEIKFAIKKYPEIQYIHFIDDILPLKKVLFAKFAKLYKENISLPYVAHARPNLLDEEIIKILKESNCIQLQIGLESGNDYIRNKILKRNISRQQIVDAFTISKKYGIKTYSYNMTGIPFETKDSALDTMKLNASLDIDLFQISLYYPYPKTELEKVCMEQNLIEKEWNIDCFTDSILKFDKPTKEFFVFLRGYFVVLVKFYSRMYKLPKTLSKITIGISDIIIKNYIFCKFANKVRATLVKTRNIIKHGKKK